MVGARNLARRLAVAPATDSIQKHSYSALAAQQRRGNVGGVFPPGEPSAPQASKES